MATLGISRITVTAESNGLICRGLSDLAFQANKAEIVGLNQRGRVWMYPALGCQLKLLDLNQ